MSSSRGSLWITFLVTLLALAALYKQFGSMLPGTHKQYVIESAAPGTIASENYYSPDENLERVDYDRLDSAKESLDLAMYAFTDKYLADEIVKLARGGVHVRIYRDHDQYQGEERNASSHQNASTTEMFRGEANIHIRIKQSGRRDLMHLKAYCIDGRLLRDGSANWSAAGLKVQDNNAHFTNDPAQIKAFADDFETMWSRSDNIEVQ